ncbi:hypothetical protein NT2_06_00150 [Caenibius tardaugens NBRC 16725]|uniref:Vgr related protein n=2 Tax=Caenibius TaxID=2827482 RepID=U2Y8K0_9SPHN|nr:hypothetical protein NT2_06_00150 [Caenibius tardaugens NBRC 16725]
MERAACPAGGERPLTEGEVALVRSMFGTAIDCGLVTLRRRKWFPFQPRDRMMAPCGHVHFHPKDPIYCDDFATASLDRQGYFLHEMTHVWQAQVRGRFYLPLRRHPFCRYGYMLAPGRPLHRYGIEQQAEIIRHAFLMRHGRQIAGVSDVRAYDMLVNFAGADKRD